MSTERELMETPEGTCGACGKTYRVWSAANPVWNKVMANAGEVGMICPTCFMNRSEGIWEVRPDWFQPPEWCACETPRRSWNPAEPCLTCGGKLRDQEATNQPAAPTTSQGQIAAPGFCSVTLAPTSTRSQNSGASLGQDVEIAFPESLSLKLAAAENLAEALEEARLVIHGECCASFHHIEACQDAASALSEYSKTKAKEEQSNENTR